VSISFQACFYCYCNPSTFSASSTTKIAYPTAAMLFSRLIASALCLWGVQGLPSAVQEENSLSRRTLPAAFVEHAAQAIKKYAVGTSRTSAYSSPTCYAKIAPWLT
jgi:hypothetical protein